MTDIRALALETDTALSKVDFQIYTVNMRLLRLKEQRSSLQWRNQSLDKTDESIAAAEAEFVSLKAEYRRLNQIWIDHGRWTRTFVVHGGHVHSSLDCHTCYPTTQFYWYVEFSGADEQYIVENAGDRACTVCYPSAPVDRPTTMYTPDEKQSKVDAETRAAAKIEREAKRIAKAATKWGADLMIPDAYSDRMEPIKTEVTARQEWNRAEDSKEYYGGDWKDKHGSDRLDRLHRIQEIIEVSLADKHGVTPEAMRDELQTRYAKRKR
jgi:hypothetical protein